MATIRKEVLINACPDDTWEALRDFANLHTRLVPGFVTACVMDGETRVVTFANGNVARERFISSDDTQKRLCWSIEGAPFKHHNGVAQIFPEGEGCRFVWTADLLPHELAPAIGQMMEMGIQTIRKTLEK